MKNACKNCDHRDEKRTKNGKIRCKKFHLYRDRDDWCDYHQNKEIEQMLEHLEKEEERQFAALDAAIGEAIKKEAARSGVKMDVEEAASLSAPRVRGEWKMDCDGESYCSVCGAYSNTEREKCPVCGAKMNREEERKQ